MSTHLYNTSTHSYQQTILQGIQSLPPEALSEIADFVLFIRQKWGRPQDFQDDLYSALLNTELHALSQTEEAHLAQEFADYEQCYPYE